MYLGRNKEYGVLEAGKRTGIHGKMYLGRK